jgi:hypothetical protein
MTNTPPVAERETQGAIDFDAALEGYACGCDDPEVLLRAASLVLGSTILLGREHASAIAELTGAIGEFATYDDAERAVQRWFAADAEAGKSESKQRQRASQYPD